MPPCRVKARQQRCLSSNKNLDLWSDSGPPTPDWRIKDHGAGATLSCQRMRATFQASEPS